ncbi:MAG TPA: metal-dependent transcriptional regulator [Candidatus Binatia bacterium]|nr:metal-dependent transcriptional regulator [Candidatus Binatia bacterium]
MSIYTVSVEDYLKAIFELSQATGSAVTSEVASRLAVASASVSAMVRRLTGQGLVSHERYGALRLTKKGRTVALQLVRRHRVIEAYLVTALGYPWDEVHSEAERLEHAASPELINRMAAAIGEPAVDPHGAPIPTAHGKLEEPRYRSLGDLAPGERARIVRVEDEDPELLRYLASLRFVPGATVRCLKKEPYEGPLTIRVGAKAHVIGPPLAARVFVNAP